MDKPKFDRTRYLRMEVKKGIIIFWVSICIEETLIKLKVKCLLNLQLEDWMQKR